MIWAHLCILIIREKILSLRKGPTEGLDNTSLKTEAKYSVSFSRSNKKFCLRLHYNGSNSFLFVNATKNISVQSKRLWNRKISVVSRK